MWPLPPHVVPSQAGPHQQRFVGAPPTAEQFASMQQQQLKNQQQAAAFQQQQQQHQAAAAAAAAAAQQQQSQFAEAQRRQATANVNFYGTPAALPASLVAEAAAGVPSTGAHSPGSVQKSRVIF